jgi:nucleoside-diphosphate-sugar epimerase
MTSQKQKIALVTGGSGFIGSELIHQLCANGFRVRALLRSSSSKENFRGCEVEECIGDLLDYESLKKAVDGVDYVFHLAGVTSAIKRAHYFLYNKTGTANLAKACAENAKNLKRFVYVSSLAASGPAQNLTPRIETDAEFPVSAYGESKLEGEKQLLKFSEERYPISIVRPPAVYGPRDKGVFEFFKMIQKGICIELPSFNPTKNKYYSLIHVEDLVRAIIKAALVEDQGKREIYFVSDQNIYTWNQIMDTIASNLQKKPFKIYLPSFLLWSLSAFFSFCSYLFLRPFPLSLDKYRELKPDFWICSSARAKTKLDFRPKFDLQTGIVQTTKWYKDNGWL